MAVRTPMFTPILTIALATVISFAATPAWSAEPSPYAGQETRRIKALSENDIQGYLAGKGMGFAKAAELNQYPGPLHVLDLAERMKMDGEQRRKVDAIFAAMKSEASRLGAAIVAKEEELDRLFAQKKITHQSLRELTAEIGRLTGKLRGAHLAAHLNMVEVLTPHQVAQYDRLRGYAGGHDAGGQGNHGHGSGGHGPGMHGPGMHGGEGHGGAATPEKG